jgi:hypothetical protein
VNKLYKIIGQILEALLDARARASQYYWNWFNSYHDMEEARKWARYYKARYKEMENKYWEAQDHIGELYEPSSRGPMDDWLEGYRNWINNVRWDEPTPTEWEIGYDWLDCDSDDPSELT